MYKFLGVEQADGIKTKQVYERIKEEMTKRLKLQMKSEPNDENLIQAIMHQSIPSTNILPPGRPLGFCTPLLLRGRDLYLMTFPGGRVFAYP